MDDNSNYLVINEDQIDSFNDAVNTIENLIESGQKATLLCMWGVGKIIAHLQEDEGKYGSNAVERIAKKTGKKTRILQEMLRFYNGFPKKEDVSKLSIEWSSAREVLRIPDLKKRSEVIEKAQEDNLTVRQVRSIVDEACNDPSVTEKPKTRSTSAKAWYLKMLAMLENDLDQLKSKMEKYPEAAYKATDMDKTPEEDYQLIANGDDEQEAIIKQIEQVAIRLASFLKTQVIPIGNSFESIGD